jgi:protein gp37
MNRQVESKGNLNETGRTIGIAIEEPELVHRTKIRWTEFTWNPMSGCEAVSPGCTFCYARTLAERLRGTAAFPNGFDLTSRPHKLTEPMKLKEPSLIFVDSTSDLFWESVEDTYRDQIIDVIESTPQHQYQVLTKRHESMLRYSRRRRLPANFWAGVTAEDQVRADLRIPCVLQVDVPVRFVSVEPALSLVDISGWVSGKNNAAGGDGLQWVIWGGESGLHLKDEKVRAVRGCAVRDERGKWSPHPDRMDWPRTLRDVCAANGIPFFFKQWGGVCPASAGHELDGRRWEEFPDVQGRAR